MASTFGRVWQSVSSEKAAFRAQLAMTALLYGNHTWMIKQHDSLTDELQRERQEKVGLKVKNDQHWDHLYRQLDERGVWYTDHRKKGGDTGAKGSGAGDLHAQRPQGMGFIRWPNDVRWPRDELKIASPPIAQ